MTKQEWKEKLAALLDAEPDIRDKRKFSKEFIKYLNMLEHKENDYYGIRFGIIVAIEAYLEI